MMRFIALVYFSIGSVLSGIRIEIANKEFYFPGYFPGYFQGPGVPSWGGKTYVPGGPGAPSWGGLAFQSSPFWGGFGELDRYACDKELEALIDRLAQTCVSLMSVEQSSCRSSADNLVKHGTRYPWVEKLFHNILREKILVLWAGFSSEDKSGTASREDLSAFVKKVEGVELNDTTWGQMAAAPDVNDLNSCGWDREKFYWGVGSAYIAHALREVNAEKVYIVVKKTLTKLFRTVMYLAELPSIGIQLGEHPEWKPKIHIVDLQTTVSGNCSRVATAILDRLQTASGRQDLQVTCSSCDTKPAECVDRLTSDRRAVIKMSDAAWWQQGVCMSCKQRKMYKKERKKQRSTSGKEAVGKRKNTKRNSRLSTKKQKKQTSASTSSDCKNGLGTFCWYNGNEYEGEWKNDLMDGQGRFKMNSGFVYQGTFKKGAAEGKSKVTYEDGTKNGTGNYQVYDGELKNFMMEGQGTWRSAIGDEYVGEFKRDAFEGHGTLRYAHGESYEGEFKNGLFEGQGTKRDKNGYVQQQGEWKNDRFVESSSRLLPAFGYR